jgi:hypothetical protein
MRFARAAANAGECAGRVQRQEADLLQQHVGASECSAFPQAAADIVQKLLLAREVVGAVYGNAGVERWAEAQGAEQTAGVAARDLHVAFEPTGELTNA